MEMNKAAIILPPSAFPLHFTMEVRFPGEIFGTNNRANPKGIHYHQQRKEFIVSVTNQNTNTFDRTQILNTAKLDGTRAAFAPDYTSFRGVESEIAIVPPSGPPINAGFVAGEIFVGRGRDGEISRLSAAGMVIADVFTTVPVMNQSLWGALCFDTHGSFGGRLIAVTTLGLIFLVNADGTFAMPAPYNDLSGNPPVIRRAEGAGVAPATFGPHAGHLIIGVEGEAGVGGGDGNADPESGKVYAVSNNPADPPVLLADVGFMAESIAFVPPRGGTYAQAELAFDRDRENRVLIASASQFIGRVGRLIVASEITGEFTEVNWDGVQYTQSFIGRAPGPWTSEGFNQQLYWFAKGINDSLPAVSITAPKHRVYLVAVQAGTNLLHVRRTEP